MEQKLVVAADFGNGKIAVAAALKNELNQIEMIDFKSKTIKNLISDGKIVDENALASEVVAMIQQIETDNNLQIDKVHFAVAPHTLRSEIRKVNIETSDSSDILEELIDKAEEIEISATRSVFDVVPLERTTIGNSKAEGNFLVVSVQNAVQKQFTDIESSALSAYKPKCFIAPLVEAKRFLSGEQKRNGTLFVDMGFGCTSFAVYKENLPRLCAVIPLGSKHISSDIAKKFDIQISTAEKLKTDPEYGLAIENDLKIGGEKPVEAQELKKVIFARLDEIFNFIFDEMKNQKLENIKEIVLVGGGAKMNFLPEHLTKTRNVEVKIADIEVTTNKIIENFVCPENALLYALLKNCDEDCKKSEKIVEPPKKQKKKKNKNSNLSNDDIKTQIKNREDRTGIKDMFRNFWNMFDEDKETKTY